MNFLSTLPFGAHSLCFLITFQHDGSHVQVQIKSQTHAILQQNWVHSSPKYGVRFDGQPPLPVGRDGTMHSNVVWKCNGMMVKGDNHTVQHNLVFDKRNEKDGDHQGDKCSLCILRYVRENPVPINNGTVVLFNGADKANGGKHGGELYPLAGSVVKFNVIGKLQISWSIQITSIFDLFPIPLIYSTTLDPTAITPRSRTTGYRDGSCIRQARLSPLTIVKR